MIGTSEGAKPLAALSDPKLWELLKKLGVDGLHTGPVLEAGGLRPSKTGSLEPYPTIDGWFDPIAFRIDKALGETYSEDAAHDPGETGSSRAATNDYELAVTAAHENKVMIIGDVVPGHTGMGPDFHLALSGFELYPGLYVLVRIDDKMTGLDPVIRRQLEEKMYSPGELSLPLTQEEIDELRDKDIIPGSPQRPMGAEAGYGWSITREIEGVRGSTSAFSGAASDRVSRRWVYLHFFNPQQPTLNWIDPGFAAWRLITGELNYLMWKSHSDGVRFDANSFLGLEIVPKNGHAEPAIKKASSKVFQTWSEAHPLSELVTNMLAWQARRLGGFSFQEMNMSMPELTRFSELGPDLAYDFLTRPACEHALLTANTDLLTLMYSEMEDFNVNPLSLIHALQNHDDLTYELVHLSASGDKLYMLGDEEVPAYLPQDRDNEQHYWRVDKKRREQTAAAAGAAVAEPEKPFASATPLSIWGRIRQEMRKHAVVGHDFNRELENGICTTLAGFVAARLGCTTLDELRIGEVPEQADEEQRDAIETANKAPKRKREQIKTGHLLLAAFNALQPGVFAVSGWDLVGSLPLDKARISDNLLLSGLPAVTRAGEPRTEDFRWVNRGAYKILSSYAGLGTMNSCEENIGHGPLEIPEAQALYGPIDVQVEDPVSFFSQLRRLLAVRNTLGIQTGQFGGVLDLGNPEVFGMLTWLTDVGRSTKSAAIVLLNFSNTEKHTVTANPQHLEGWSRHWRKRWSEDGLLEVLREREAERERSRLKRWRLFDALPAKTEYDATAPFSKGSALGAPVDIEPWGFRLFHLRPTLGGR